MPVPYDQLTWQKKQFGGGVTDRVTDALSATADLAGPINAQNVTTDTANYTVASKAAAAAYGSSGGFDIKTTPGTLAAAGYDVVKTNKLSGPPAEISRRDQALYSVIKKDESLVRKAAGATLTTAANGGQGGFEYKASGNAGAGGGWDIVKTAAPVATPPYADTQAVLVAQSKHRDSYRDREDGVSNKFAS